MTKLNTMKNATSIEIDFEYGFAYAHDGDDSNNLFQVCLQQRADNKGFKKEISKEDCGWDWGVCGDYNKSVGANEYDYIEFLKLARKHGIKVS